MHPYPLRRHRNPQQQRVKSTFVSKFPVIDEDLLALAKRKTGNDITMASNPPPNLCRLITNVSECRWTAKRPSIISTIFSEENENKVDQKENDDMDEEKSEEMVKVPKIQLRKESTHQKQQMAAVQLGKANGMLMPMTNKAKTTSDVVALHRLSALSMVSSVSSNGFGTAVDDAANCDCTSLAMSVFRRSSYNGRSQKRRKQLEQQQKLMNDTPKAVVADLDDSYRKISPSTSSTLSMTTAATTLGETSRSTIAGADSGISSSSDSSRSTSLSDNANYGGLQQNVGSNKNCLNCGRKFLPPPAVPDSTKSSLQLLSRRRRALNYLLGNMMRFLQQDISTKKCCQCQRCGINLKLMTVSSTTLTSASTVTMNNKVPLINIEMVNDENSQVNTIYTNKL